MKVWPFAVAASVGLNVTLAAFILVRSPASKTAPALTVAAKDTATAATDDRLAALHAALASGDSTALAAAGFPPEAVRALIVGRAFDRFQAIARTQGAKQRDPKKYWQPGQQDPASSRTERLLFREEERKLSAAFREAYGYDLETLFNGENSPHDFLSPAKREKLRRIEEDYRDLSAQIEDNILNGLQLPGDREKIALLNREKERDIATILTPEEREQLAFRSSDSAKTVQSRFGQVIQTEEEYREFYSLQKAFDDRFFSPEEVFAGISPAMAQARQAAEEKLNEQFRSALSPDQFAALQRANDHDRRTASSVAQRLGFPDSTVEAVLALRAHYAAQSMQINSNAGLTLAERQTQLQTLAARSQDHLQTALGTDGAEVYAQNSPWIRLLKSGLAFSVDPKDAPTASDAFSSTVFSVPHPTSIPPPASAK